jgi:hypothetical protein
MAGPLKLQEELTCDECGQFGALEIGAGKYCAGCHGILGSSCGGGGDEKPTE